MPFSPILDDRERVGQLNLNILFPDTGKIDRDRDNFPGESKFASPSRPESSGYLSMSCN
jgi:hypothetical protein